MNMHSTIIQFTLENSCTHPHTTVCLGPAILVKSTKVSSANSQKQMTGLKTSHDMLMCLGVLVISSVEGSYTDGHMQKLRLPRTNRFVGHRNHVGRMGRAGITAAPK